jgi:hypothetical protein
MVGFGSDVIGPRHLAVVFQGLARLRLCASLPVVVAGWSGHVRHLGGNSTQLDIPDVGTAEVDRSGPFTRFNAALALRSTRSPHLGHRHTRSPSLRSAR